MPFDANLVLCDGTTDWSYANLVTPLTYGRPTSTTVTGGFAVIDLLALSGTAAQGMAAIFIADQTALATGDYLTLTVEGCDSTTFSYTAGPPIVKVQTLATFDILGGTLGRILGSECPCTVIRRFATTMRYIRAHAVVGNGDNFYTCYVLLAPWPFHVL